MIASLAACLSPYHSTSKPLSKTGGCQMCSSLGVARALSVSLSLCVCVCLSVSVSLFLFLSLSVCLSSLYLPVCLSVCLSVSLSLSLALSPPFLPHCPLSPSPSPSIPPPPTISICLSIYLLVFLSIYHLCVCLFMYLAMSNVETSELPRMCNILQTKCVKVSPHLGTYVLKYVFCLLSRVLCMAML